LALKPPVYFALQVFGETQYIGFSTTGWDNYDDRRSPSGRADMWASPASGVGLVPGRAGGDGVEAIPNGSQWSVQESFFQV